MSKTIDLSLGDIVCDLLGDYIKPSESVKLYDINDSLIPFCPLDIKDVIKYPQYNYLYKRFLSQLYNAILDDTGLFNIQESMLKGNVDCCNRSKLINDDLLPSYTLNMLNYRLTETKDKFMKFYGFDKDINVNSDIQEQIAVNILVNNSKYSFEDKIILGYLKQLAKSDPNAKAALDKFTTYTKLKYDSKNDVTNHIASTLRNNIYDIINPVVPDVDKAFTDKLVDYVILNIKDSDKIIKLFNNNLSDAEITSMRMYALSKLPDVKNGNIINNMDLFNAYKTIVNNFNFNDPSIIANKNSLIETIKNDFRRLSQNQPNFTSGEKLFIDGITPGVYNSLSCSTKRILNCLMYTFIDYFDKDGNEFTTLRQNYNGDINNCVRYCFFPKIIDPETRYIDFLYNVQQAFSQTNRSSINCVNASDLMIPVLQCRTKQFNCPINCNSNVSCSNVIPTNCSNMICSNSNGSSNGNTRMPITLNLSEEGNRFFMKVLNKDLCPLDVMMMYMYALNKYPGSSELKPATNAEHLNLVTTLLCKFGVNYDIDPVNACGVKINVKDFDSVKLMKKIFCKMCDITPECKNNLKKVINFIQQFVDKVKVGGYYEDNIESKYILEDINNPFYNDRKIFKENLIKKYNNNEFTYDNIAKLIPQFAVDMIEAKRHIESTEYKGGFCQSLPNNQDQNNCDEVINYLLNKFNSVETPNQNRTEFIKQNIDLFMEAFSNNGFMYNDPVVINPYSFSYGNREKLNELRIANNKISNIGVNYRPNLQAIFNSLSSMKQNNFSISDNLLNDLIGIIGDIVIANRRIYIFAIYLAAADTLSRLLSSAKCKGVIPDEFFEKMKSKLANKIDSNDRIVLKNVKDLNEYMSNLINKNVSIQPTHSTDVCSNALKVNWNC